MNEVEIKFAVDDVAALESKLRELGFRLQTPSTHELNTCYDFPNGQLRKRGELKMIQPSIIQINSLENKADDLLRAGLAELFDNPTDVLHIIKWRDIYQEMEEVTDKAEDIADVLRGLAIKHA